MAMSNLVFIVIPSVFILTLTLNLTLAERQFWFPRANETLDDVLFPNNVLFDGEVRSNLECVTSCVQTSGCFFSTFYGGNRCRGHSVAETSPAAGTATPGARTYIADEWLNIPCDEASECPTRVDHVQCFSGKCNCEPGYYYSVSTRQCIAACPDSDLQDDFTLYPLHGVTGYNIATGLNAASLTVCRAHCLDYFANNGVHCRTAEFYIPALRCNLGVTTALDDPTAWGPDANHHYSQRKCA